MFTTILLIAGMVFSYFRGTRLGKRTAEQWFEGELEAAKNCAYDEGYNDGKHYAYYHSND